MQSKICRLGVLLVAALALGACGDDVNGTDRIGAGGDISGGSPSELSEGKYRTASEHFAELQQAALSADYNAFARHMGADNAEAVVTRLEESFGGAPFDVYTLDVENGAGEHRRAAELRGPSGRLYLYLELAREGGGWAVRRAEFEPDRAAALAYL